MRIPGFPPYPKYDSSKHNNQLFDDYLLDVAKHDRMLWRRFKLVVGTLVFLGACAICSVAWVETNGCTETGVLLSAKTFNDFNCPDLHDTSPVLH